MSLDNHVLAHEGIKGMRWGVRRGPPYPLKRNEKRAPVKESQKKVKKEVSEMSDDELRKVLNRLQMERQYKELTQKQRADGLKFVEDLLTLSSRELAKKYVMKYGSLGIDLLEKKIRKP